MPPACPYCGSQETERLSELPASSERYVAPPPRCAVWQPAAGMLLVSPVIGAVLGLAIYAGVRLFTARAVTLAQVLGPAVVGIGIVGAAFAVYLAFALYSFNKAKWPWIYDEWRRSVRCADCGRVFVPDTEEWK